MKAAIRYLLAAALLAAMTALTACGDDGGGGGSGDADADTDADTDADSDSDADGDRTIVTNPNGDPVAGVDVLLHGADGALLDRTTTDADGVAVTPFVEGGGVSVAFTEMIGYATGTDLRVESVLGLSPGDEVRLVIDAYAESSRPYMTLSFDSDALGGEMWDVNVSCRSDGDAYEAEIQYWGCPDRDTFDVFVTNGGDLVQVFADQPYDPGGSASFALDFAEAESVAPVAFTASGLPVEATSFGAAIRAYRPTGGWNTHGHSTAPEAGAATVNVERPYVAAGGGYVLFAGASDGLNYLQDRLPVDELPATFPWTLPELARVETIGDLGGTPARPELPWTLTSTGALGDAVVLTLAYETIDPDSELPEQVEWVLTLPAAASGVAFFPEIPSELVPWIPASPYFESAAVSHVALAEGDGLLDAVNAERDGRATSTASTSVSAPELK